MFARFLISFSMVSVVSSGIGDESSGTRREVNHESDLTVSPSGIEADASHAVDTYQLVNGSATNEPWASEVHSGHLVLSCDDLLPNERPERPSAAGFAPDAASKREDDEAA